MGSAGATDTQTAFNAEVRLTPPPALSSTLSLRLTQVEHLSALEARLTQAVTEQSSVLMALSQKLVRLTHYFIRVCPPHMSMPTRAGGVREHGQAGGAAARSGGGCRFRRAASARGRGCGG